MLKLASDGDTIRAQFDCPVVEETDWNLAILKTLQSMSFKASEMRMAEQYDGDKDKLNRQLGEYSSHGAGQHLGYMQMVDFDNDVRNMIWKRRRTGKRSNLDPDL